MQLLRGFLLLTIFTAISAKRTIWERSSDGTPKRRLETSSNPLFSQSLGSINTVAQGKMSIGDIMDSLVQNALEVEEGFDAVNVNKLFDNINILRQTPSYKAAMAAGANLGEDATAKSVMQGALQEFAAMSSNMFNFVSSNANGGIDKKMSNFFAEDVSRVLLAEKVRNGDLEAGNELQQQFASAVTPGLNITELTNSVDLAAKRARLADNKFLTDALASGGADGGKMILSVLQSDSLGFTKDAVNAFKDFVVENS